ncbi:hypothetical protein C1752_03206 [Acaryochloris thomasi RCC1774]|uniref:Uncharacterized protein n=1 Tax=Acaryochloris thomasi RCC1774 TaxID=1764569 RepID=A0A2W1JHH2_9CYAN|nr:sulfotransferase [Acaryochloris thomasi]PZD72796.1 hypothetical protein C1752_03206 [Acaryochloris thomasi RCC1774]
MNSSYQPLILIGAARSGTKLLRDSIACHPHVDKVPYDINYVWKFGNEDIPHDELKIDDLNNAIRTKIASAIDRFSRGSPYIIEKTVSNCLRVPYVASVFPDAKYLHIVRNGFDVIESVARQWTAQPDWQYIFQKALTFPILDAFGYGISYTKKTIQSLWVSDSKNIATWGVRYDGIDEDIKVRNLLEVCAIQWSQSVSKASAGLKNINSENLLLVRYEDFVENPNLVLEKIAEFANIDLSLCLKSTDLGAIRKDEVGKGIRTLTLEQRKSISPIIEKELALFSY